MRCRSQVGPRNYENLKKYKSTKMKLIKKYLNDNFRILALIGAVIAVPLLSGTRSTASIGYP